ncbi:hypothetical protein AB0M50_12665 [Nonomuraea fuscirosea]|uniref:hypothetical protein n=1 Tax=Nonomuraea fuscirosea TaxID=1291556 RepID=UPI002DD91DBF|nr:hypothetical protein [Nonomuraea fuscirosea]WSA48424.1 hypothetical protein OIE67_30610 [Nonomuraea fuscirosea]
MPAALTRITTALRSDLVSGLLLIDAARQVELDRRGVGAVHRQQLHHHDRLTVLGHLRLLRGDVLGLDALPLRHSRRRAAYVKGPTAEATHPAWERFGGQLALCIPFTDLRADRRI